MVEGLTQRQAYYKAYPKSKKWKESSVDSKASQLFADAKVQQRYFELLKKVSEKLETDTIASKQEVLEFFTKLMRKELKDQVVSSKSDKEVWTDEMGNRREKATRDPVIVEIDTRNAEAFKGAEALAKHYNILSMRESNDDELSAVDKLLLEIEKGAKDETDG